MKTIMILILLFATPCFAGSSTIKGTPTATGVADTDYGDVTVTGGAWDVENDSHGHLSIDIISADASKIFPFVSSDVSTLYLRTTILSDDTVTQNTKLNILSNDTVTQTLQLTILSNDVGVVKTKTTILSNDAVGWTATNLKATIISNDASKIFPFVSSDVSTLYTKISIVSTDTKGIYFESPVVADDFKSIWRPKQACTLTSIWAESDQTVSFFLEVDDGSPLSVDTVALAPAAGVAEDTALNGDTTMATGDRLDLAISSVSGTPTWVSIQWTFKYDN